MPPKKTPDELAEANRKRQEKYLADPENREKQNERNRLNRLKKKEAKAEAEAVEGVVVPKVRKATADEKAGGGVPKKSAEEIAGGGVPAGRDWAGMLETYLATELAELRPKGVFERPDPPLRHPTKLRKDVVLDARFRDPRTLLCDPDGYLYRRTPLMKVLVLTERIDGKSKPYTGERFGHHGGPSVNYDVLFPFRTSDNDYKRWKNPMREDVKMPTDVDGIVEVVDDGVRRISWKGKTYLMFLPQYGKETAEPWVYSEDRNQAGMIGMAYFNGCPFPFLPDDADWTAFLSTHPTQNNYALPDWRIQAWKTRTKSATLLDAFKNMVEYREEAERLSVESRRKADELQAEQERKKAEARKTSWTFTDEFGREQTFRFPPGGILTPDTKGVLGDESMFEFFKVYAGLGFRWRAKDRKVKFPAEEMERIAPTITSEGGQAFVRGLAGVSFGDLIDAVLREREEKARPQREKEERERQELYARQREWKAEEQRVKSSDEPYENIGGGHSMVNEGDLTGNRYIYQAGLRQGLDLKDKEVRTEFIAWANSKSYKEFQNKRMEENFGLFQASRGTPVVANTTPEEVRKVMGGGPQSDEKMATFQGVVNTMPKSEFAKKTLKAHYDEWSPTYVGKNKHGRRKKVEDDDEEED
jgi:hypothetical protein